MNLDVARNVLRLEAEAITRLAERIDERFLLALDILAGCTGRVVTTGMGKSGLIARKIAATLASTGSPSLYLHPADAIHGDLGMVARGDAVVALSNSGESEELIRLLEVLQRLGVPVVALTGRPDSPLGRHATVCLDTGHLPEACHLGLAPTTSTTAALALGDALAVALSLRKGFKMEDFAALHPGGKLGKRLRLVRDLMRVGADLPHVEGGSSMRDVIYVMTAGRMGVTAVTDPDSRLVGVITDGDLRRLMARHDNPLALDAASCMTRHPKTIAGDALASAALALMEENKITSLFIVDSERRLEGALHLHDLWEMELF